MTENYLIRVAWYDRDTNKYDWGSWKHFKLIKEMKDWVYKQNRLYPIIRYWIEYKENYDSTEIKNIEEINYIKVDNENNNDSDYLLIN
tara:strand:- start:2756 stop:3019 length:264 start_codon:yes stop_codon:yes gene_type:complete